MDVEAVGSGREDRGACTLPSTPSGRLTARPTPPRTPSRSRTRSPRKLIALAALQPVPPCADVPVIVSSSTVQSPIKEVRCSTRYLLALDTAPQLSGTLASPAVPALTPPGAGRHAVQQVQRAQVRSSPRPAASPGCTPSGCSPTAAAPPACRASPTHRGYPPSASFMLRSSVVNSNSRPSSDGTLPLRLSLDSSTSVTRLGVPLVVTPSQLVMAVSTLQFNVAVPPSASLLASSASQSCTSPPVRARARHRRPGRARRPRTAVGSA